MLVVGDLHGDPRFTVQTFRKALDVGADCIVQVGDFGYWEHMRGGDAYLDYCSELAKAHALPLFWIDGNHENHTLLRAVYGPGGPKHKPTPEGFWEIRDGVYHIPRGTRWSWSNVRMMGLGGAYSVDKYDRLGREKKKYRDHVEANNHRVKAGAPTRRFDPSVHQEWWPEEEITDAELAAAIADPAEIDILFTHDKPRGSNPEWNRKDIQECWPNQDKIQTVVRSLHPKLLVHGHLHWRYRDTIPAGDDGLHCRVEGLSCNVDARFAPADDDPETAWLHVWLERPGDEDEIVGDQV